VGITLEELEPNFYRVKVPDNGFVTVHTTINTCSRILGIIRCCCDIVGSPGGAPVPLAAVAVLMLLLYMRGRRRRARVS
jgi:MYXO-CTERM domain-containing protein